jgi:hypothetical protein
MKRSLFRCAIGCAAVVAILFLLMIPGPRLQYVATQPKDSNGTTHLEYELSNRSSWPIYYYGYGPTLPLYRVSYRTGLEWKTRPTGWCGTGAQYNRLGPWKSVNVLVNTDNVGTSRVFRVGVPFLRTTWLPYGLLYRTTKSDPSGCVWSDGLKIEGQNPSAN